MTTLGELRVLLLSERFRGLPDTNRKDRTVSVQTDVRKFHAVFNLPRRLTPGLPGPYDHPERSSRRALLHAEVEEYQLAEQDGFGDLEGIARKLADIVYVAYGTAVAYGIDLDGVLAEVHHANMSKSDPCVGMGTDLTHANCECRGTGRVVRLDSDGRVIKPEGWEPPDIEAAMRINRLAR